MPFSNLPLTTRTYATRSLCLGFRFACSLKTKAVNSGWSGPISPAVLSRGEGRSEISRKLWGVQCRVVGRLMSEPIEEEAGAHYD